MIGIIQYKMVLVGVVAVAVVVAGWADTKKIWRDASGHIIGVATTDSMGRPMPGSFYLPACQISGPQGNIPVENHATCQSVPQVEWTATGTGKRKTQMKETKYKVKSVALRRASQLCRNVIVSAVVLAAAVCCANNRTTVRDSNGRLQSTATTQNNTTTYRDSQGRLQGTSTTHNGTTTYRDAQGHLQGTSTTQNGTTTYRDAQGRVQGRSR